MSARDDARKFLQKNKLDARLYRNGNDPRRDGPAPLTKVTERPFFRAARAGIVGVGAALMLSACGYNPYRLAATTDVPEYGTMVSQGVSAVKAVDPKMKVVVFDLSGLYTPRPPQDVLKEVEKKQKLGEQPIDNAKLKAKLDEVGAQGKLQINVRDKGAVAHTLTFEQARPELEVYVRNANASSITFALGDAHGHEDKVCLVTTYRQTASPESFMAEFSQNALPSLPTVKAAPLQKYVAEHEFGHCLDEDHQGQRDPFVLNHKEAFADAYGLMRTIQEYPNANIVPLIRDLRTTNLLSRADVNHFSPPAFYDKVSEVITTLKHQGRFQDLSAADMIEIADALAHGKASEKFADLNLEQKTLTQEEYDVVKKAADTAVVVDFNRDIKTGKIVLEGENAELFDKLDDGAKSVVTAYNQAVDRLESNSLGKQINSHGEAVRHYNEMLDETLAMQGTDPHKHLETLGFHLRLIQQQVREVEDASYKNPKLTDYKARTAYVKDTLTQPGNDGLSLSDKWDILQHRTEQTVDYIKEHEAVPAKPTPDRDHGPVAGHDDGHGRL
ncbi:MAG: hypothetical protein GC134_09505 [Proteobacteria bacterium]|nr:hypothetical protein [Pseudomonadota bacterium]